MRQALSADFNNIIAVSNDHVKPFPAISDRQWPLGKLITIDGIHLQAI